jgi:uncharacterized protein (TIGR04255 family)
VSAGVQFHRLLKWQTRHFGDFWRELHTEFPETMDAPPVESIPEGQIQFEISLSPLPPLRRVLMVSQDKSYLVQVQESRFHVNWRKQPSNEYPHFPAVYSRYQQALHEFGKFVGNNELGEIKAEQYELTYLNHIPTQSSDFASSLEGYVKLFRWSDVNPKYLAAPTSATASWQFVMPGGAGVMRANLTHVKLPPTNDVLVLALACSGSPSPNYTPDQWYEYAHQMIVRGFADLTTDDAQRKWERIV